MVNFQSHIGGSIQYFLMRKAGKICISDGDGDYLNFRIV